MSLFGKIEDACALLIMIAAYLPMMFISLFFGESRAFHDFMIGSITHFFGRLFL
jgi:hypothetical protein